MKPTLWLPLIWDDWPPLSRVEGICPDVSCNPPEHSEQRAEGEDDKQSGHDDLHSPCAIKSPQALIRKANVKRWLTCSRPETKAAARDEEASRAASLHPGIVVIDAGNVALVEVHAGLDLDHDERRIADVLEPVMRS